LVKKYTLRNAQLIGDINDEMGWWYCFKENQKKFNQKFSQRLKSTKIDINPKSKPSNKANVIVKETKIGRNELCPCNSGKKYKKCCGK